MKIKLHEGIRDAKKVLTSLNHLLTGMDLPPIHGGTFDAWTRSYLNGRENGITIHFDEYNEEGELNYRARFDVGNIRNGEGVVVHEYIWTTKWESVNGRCFAATDTPGLHIVEAAQRIYQRLTGHYRYKTSRERGRA
jgi:hypothetical protein|tara:strand:+ start:24699 stop:25109 length:411 start_codon:yes stop_codon:yes gene_type:complete